MRRNRAYQSFPPSYCYKYCISMQYLTLELAKLAFIVNLIIQFCWLQTEFMTLFHGTWYLAYFQSCPLQSYSIINWNRLLLQTKTVNFYAFLVKTAQVQIFYIYFCFIFRSAFPTWNVKTFKTFCYFNCISILFIFSNNHEESASPISMLFQATFLAQSLLFLIVSLF